MITDDWTLDATQCNTIKELGEFCDIKALDYSSPWPTGKRPKRMLINQMVANEIVAFHKSTGKYKHPIRFRTIPCEIIK